MSQQSKIEWTGATINPIRARDIGKVGISQATGKVGWFCEKISPGCANCYASKMNIWRGNGLEFLPENADRVELFLDEKTLESVLHWKKPRKIFWCDMTDMFQDAVKDQWLDRIFAVMAKTPQHTHQVLTKRPARMRDYMPRWKPVEQVFPHVWLGTSVENQHFADERIPLLLQTPAAVRFISAEPLLSEVKLKWEWVSRGKPLGGGPQINMREPWLEHVSEPALDWVIVGGESGPGARPMHPDWARSLRDQCQVAGVKFFFKQWGEFRPMTRTDGIHESPFGGQQMLHVGKKQAGRELDGREWNEFPQ